MRKRLRKKLGLGEFESFGFHIEFVTKDMSFTGNPNDAGDEFMTRLIQWGQNRGIWLGAGGDGIRWGAYVLPLEQNKPNPGLTERGKQDVVDYVRSQPEVTSTIITSPLVGQNNRNDGWEQFQRDCDAAFGLWV